jgi:DNA-binding NarL/FixJ family response regulator
MRKQTLLQRLVAALATNEGVQPKRTEIWRRLESLTPREVDVLCYVLGGQLNREIAEKLGLTVKTIKHHRGRAMEKLGVQSTAQLFPMVLCYVAYPAWPKFRRRREKPKKRRPVSR